MSRGIVVNATWVWLARIVGVGVGFFLMPFMLTNLGDEPVGLLSLALSFSATSGFMAILDFGMHSALVVHVARHVAKQDFSALSELTSTALVLFTTLGALAGLVLFFLTDWLIMNVFKISSALWPASQLVFRLMALEVWMGFVGMVPLAALEGNQDYGLTQGIAILISLVNAVATVVVIWLGFGVVGVAAVHAGSAVTQYGVMGYLMLRRFPRLEVSPAKCNRRHLREIIDFGRPIFGQRISGVIFRQADRLIVGSFLSVAMVAHYSIIQMVYRMVMLFQSLSAVVVPAASAAAAQENVSQLRAMFIRNTKYATWVTSGVALITAVLLQPFLLHWVGNDFVYLTPLAQAFVVMAVGASAVGIGQSMMTPLGRADRVMIYGLLSGLISVCGSLLTVHRWQLGGIVWSTVLAASIGWVLNVRLMMRELKLKFRESLIPLLARPLFSSIAVGSGLWTLVQLRVPANLFEVLSYGALAMGVQMILFYHTGLEREEKEFVRRHILFAVQTYIRRFGLSK